MKDQPEEKLFSMRELLVITIVFSVFAITLLSLVSLDPELVLWGGSMSLGSLYTPDPPPRLFDNPREAFQMASKLCLIGLVALLCLMVIKGEARFGWLSWLKARWIERRSQQALEGKGQPRIGWTPIPETLTITGRNDNDRVNLKNDVSPATRQQWGNVSMAFLRSSGLFEGISEEEARKVARLCFDRAYPKGATIFSEGDPSDVLYVVKQGLVKLTSLAESGTETILDILKPEEIFGELLITEKARAFTATAIEDAVVTVIPRERFLELLSLVPTVSRNFIGFLSKRLVKVEKGVADSSHSWSYHRLARALLHLGEKYGEETPAGTLIRLRLTHEDLSNLIGTTRETVTTQLNKFERMGLLSRKGRHLTILRPRLTEFIRSEELRLTKLDAE